MYRAPATFANQSMQATSHTQTLTDSAHGKVTRELVHKIVIDQLANMSNCCDSRASDESTILSSDCAKQRVYILLDKCWFFLVGFAQKNSSHKCHMHSAIDNLT